MPVTKHKNARNDLQSRASFGFGATSLKNLPLYATARPAVCGDRSLRLESVEIRPQYRSGPARCRASCGHNFRPKGHFKSFFGTFWHLVQKSGLKWFKVVQNYYVCLGEPARREHAWSAGAGRPCLKAGRETTTTVYDFLHQ